MCFSDNCGAKVCGMSHMRSSQLQGRCVPATTAELKCADWSLCGTASCIADVVKRQLRSKYVRNSQYAEQPAEGQMWSSDNCGAAKSKRASGSNCLQHNCLALIEFQFNSLLSDERS
jgi:hypothetical protein